MNVYSLRADTLNLASTLYAIRGPAAPQARMFTALDQIKYSCVYSERLANHSLRRQLFSPTQQLRKGIFVSYHKKTLVYYNLIVQNGYTPPPQAPCSGGQ